MVRPYLAPTFLSQCGLRRSCQNVTGSALPFTGWLLPPELFLVWTHLLCKLSPAVQMVDGVIVAKLLLLQKVMLFTC